MDYYADLKECLELLVTEFLDGLSAAEIPTKLFKKLSTADDGASWSTISRRDVDQLLDNYWLYMFSQPLYQEVEHTVLSIPELQKKLHVDVLGNSLPSDTRNPFIGHMMRRYLERYLETVQDFLFDKCALEKVFESLLAELKTCPLTEFTLKVPLIGFSLEADDFELEPGVIIRRIRDDEYERWENHSASPFRQTLLFPDHEMFACNSLIELKYEAPFYQFPEESDRWDTVLSALRLVTNHPVHSLFREITTGSFFAHAPSVMAFGHLRRSTVSRANLSKQVGEVKQLFKLLTGSLNLGKVSLALRRWERALTEGGTADKLVDIWVGLESLFATDDERHELTFKYALRIALLLGGSKDQRLDIFDRIKDSYNLRSKILHGAKLKDKHVRVLDDEVAYASNCLSRGIIAILNRNEAFSPDRVEIEFLSKAF